VSQGFVDMAVQLKVNDPVIATDEDVGPGPAAETVRDQVPVVSRLTDPCPSAIVRCMPKYHDELVAVLRALADPTRLAVVERLAKSPAVVSELAAPFSMALPSFMQHLRVLENAGLLTSQKHGRVRTASLRPGALDVLHLWLGEQRTPAERQADRLGIHLARSNPKET
jgi:DNA-binding transcriptional ArsR family regulator